MLTYAQHLTDSQSNCSCIEFLCQDYLSFLMKHWNIGKYVGAQHLSVFVSAMHTKRSIASYILIHALAFQSPGPCPHPGQGGHWTSYCIRWTDYDPHGMPHEKRDVLRRITTTASPANLVHTRVHGRQYLRSVVYHPRQITSQKQPNTYDIYLNSNILVSLNSPLAERSVTGSLELRHCV